MKIEVKKYIFVGYECDRQDFIHAAQIEGIIKFGNSVFNEKPIEEVVDITNLFDGANNIIKQNFDSLEMGMVSDIYETNPLHHLQRILSINLEKISLIKEKQKIDRIISIYSNFGIDAMADSIEYLPNKFFCLLLTNSSMSLHRRNDNIYVLHIGAFESKKCYILIGEESEFDVPVDSELILINQYYKNIYREQELLEERILNINKDISAYRISRKSLLISIQNLINSINNRYAVEQCSIIDDSKIFYVQGWCAEDEYEKLEALCNRSSVVFATTDPLDIETIPIKLKNNGIDKLGEDIMLIYDVPSYEDSDPSRWVIISFAIFYGIIVGDFGYGLTQVIGSKIFDVYLKNKASDITKRIIKTSTVLGIFTMIWGAFSGNIFGIDIGTNSYINKFVPIRYLVNKKYAYAVEKEAMQYEEYDSTFNIQDFRKSKKQNEDISLNEPLYSEYKNSIMFEFSLLIGCIHIIIGMLKDCIQRKSNIGWAIALAASYMFISKKMDCINIYDYLFSGVLGTNIYEYVGYISFCGILISLLFSVIQNGIVGFTEIMNIIQVFSDVMSYLRLYALGISGSIMATTFNVIGYNAGIIGILIIFVGHVINIILSVMSGTIHGSRLNFLEWFRYCFNGGGLILKPLKMDKDFKEN